MCGGAYVDDRCERSWIILHPLVLLKPLLSQAVRRPGRAGHGRLAVTTPDRVSEEITDRIASFADGVSLVRMQLVCKVCFTGYA